jgi:hypothetical protein
VGNSRLRTLALERKIQFDSGNYTEKRSLATEIVQIVRALKPPGRFLKKVSAKVAAKAAAAAAEKDSTEKDESNGLLEDGWEELSDEKAIHKACQVMRDIDRPDRKDRELRRAKKKQKLVPGEPGEDKEETVEEETPVKGEGDKEDSTTTKEEKTTAMDVLASTSVEKTVQDAVAETEQALDSALDAVSEVKEKVEEAESVEV